MRRFRKKNPPDKNNTISGRNMQERELVLHLKKEELFDRHILLPHAEVSDIVYTAVDQFVQKYAGETLLLTIMSDTVTQQVQAIFKEAYRLHYEDEYRKTVRYLNRRIIRVIWLLFISVAAFWCSSLLMKYTELSDYIVGIVGEISVFCLWEIGYTHFDRIDAAEERNRLARARDAVIEFHCNQ